MRRCSKCRRLLSISEFRLKNKNFPKRGYASWCKDCGNKATRECCRKIRAIPKERMKHNKTSGECQRKIYATPKGRKKCNEANRKSYEKLIATEEGRQKTRDKSNAYNRRNSYEYAKKHSAERRRNMGWFKCFENPFTRNMLVDWHHITDAYVVAVPRELHRLYYGKHHREMLMEIVKQIYLGEEV